jgi:hypothetical protein
MDKVLQQIQKAAHRQSLIDAGVYGIHKEKAHKDKKKYTRKPKHKKDLE